MTQMPGCCSLLKTLCSAEFCGWKCLPAVNALKDVDTEGRLRNCVRRVQMLFLVEQRGRKSGNMFVGGQHKGSRRASRGEFLFFFHQFLQEQHLD